MSRVGVLGRITEGWMEGRKEWLWHVAMGGRSVAAVDNTLVWYSYLYSTL